MTAGREVGTGLLYGLLSLVLVIGSLSLALSESNSTSPAISVASPTDTASVLPSATATSAPPATWLPTPTQPPPTVTTTSTLALAPPSYPFLPRTAYPPPRPGTFMLPCGPFRGWVKGYLVQPGDNLFQIAERYRTSVGALERANCRPNSILYPGERLWVPYVQTMTEGQTIILLFDTPTESPTESTPDDSAPTVTLTETVSPTP